MATVDQHRFSNQHAYAWLGSSEALQILGVKAATLYAYVSRGLVRRMRSPDGRSSRYSRDDIERLKSRHDARSGHAAVAAGALKWGEPVLDSSITEIRADGPFYRGHSAVALAEADRAFEEVAELLWTGSWPSEQAAPAARGSHPIRGFRGPKALVPVPIRAEAQPLEALLALVALSAFRDSNRFSPKGEGEARRARALVRILAAGTALARRPRPERVKRALACESVAESLAIALGARGKDAARILNRALVVSADHELNASTFAARVAASAGANLYACVCAALATLSGPEHGGMCDRVEALAAEVRDPKRARAVLMDRMRRGDAIPGFGHPLYAKRRHDPKAGEIAQGASRGAVPKASEIPEGASLGAVPKAGDPRAELLLSTLRRLGRSKGRLRTLEAIQEAMQDVGGEPPSLDLGLVAVSFALGLPPGSAAAIFAVGRSAGWVAHIFEQRAQGFLLRPRARFSKGA